MCQVDAADRLAAHLRQTGKYVFSPSPWAGDTLVASLVPLADGLAGLSFALNMRAPSIELEPVFTWLVVIATISPEVTAAVPSIQYIDQVKCVCLAGIACPRVADQFVPTIHADRQLVAEVRLAMLFVPPSGCQDSPGRGSYRCSGPFRRLIARAGISGESLHAIKNQHWAGFLSLTLRPGLDSVAERASVRPRRGGRSE